MNERNGHASRVTRPKASPSDPRRPNASQQCCGSDFGPSGRIERCAWGKMTFGAPAHGVVLRPMRQLEPEDGASRGQRWVALGVDPQFEVQHSRGNAFGAGWYLLDIDIDVHEGFFDNPCLYPDYGKGWREEDRINFVQSARPHSGVHAIVRLSHDAHGLRFDPSTAPCSFDLATFKLKQLGKLAAAMRMLRGLGSRLVREPALLGRFTQEVFATVFQSGLRGFGDWLYENHEDRSHRGNVTLDYSAWIERYDTVTSGEARGIVENASGVTRKPLISIVVPVYNTPETYLRRCIDSVLGQLYPHWELCIADDARRCRMSPKCSPSMSHATRGFASSVNEWPYFRSVE